MKKKNQIIKLKGLNTYLKYWHTIFCNSKFIFKMNKKMMPWAGNENELCGNQFLKLKVLFPTDRLILESTAFKKKYMHNIITKSKTYLSITKSMNYSGTSQVPLNVMNCRNWWDAHELLYYCFCWVKSFYKYTYIPLRYSTTNKILIIQCLQNKK